MMQIIRLGLIGALCAVVSSCNVVSATKSPPPDDARYADSAFIYGYVEATNDVIEQVDFVEFGKIYIPPFRQPPRVLVFDNGMFMAENISPGKYVISGFRSDRNHYNLARSKRQAYQRIFRIEPGEMQYLGAFNIRVTKSGKLDFGDLKVSLLQRPGERDVLKALYHVTEGTVWQDKIARRLQQLRQ